MKSPATLAPALAFPALMLAAIFPLSAQSTATATERLGTVSFDNSCSPSVHAALNRGIAMLHDFWYEEADRQFQQIATQDPSCAIAHWGAAMSYYHQIWDRPSDSVMAKGWAEMQKAQAASPKTPREAAYIAALSGIYRPGSQGYPARVAAYSSAMGEIYRQYPGADEGAFYALSLLAATSPDDTTLTQNRKAMAVLTPLWARYPNHPGIVHYIVHACDTPALAPEGLAAAERESEIAATAPHSAHMPGHIFARLGLWQKDIDANRASVAAAQVADAHHQAGSMEQFHSDDFLLYAYLQSGQDARAKEVLDAAAALARHVDAMPGMSAHMMMDGMTGYYNTKLPVFYYLEQRDWKGVAALNPVEGALPEFQTLTFWARAIAAGHLRDPRAARANLAAYDAAMEQVKKGRHAYMVGSTGDRISRSEILAWAAFAENRQEEARKNMREAAELQDKVGQDEVDIPAREMLADMLLEDHRAAEALVEYKRSLEMSPNRFNGLVQAGLAAEAVGDTAAAASYYTTLMKTTGEGAQTRRPELAHARKFLASAQVAAN